MWGKLSADRGFSWVTCVACRVLEAVVVIGIFLKLGSVMVALSTFVTVVAYFVFTVAVTKWRCVATAQNIICLSFVVVNFALSALSIDTACALSVTCEYRIKFRRDLIEADNAVSGELTPRLNMLSLYGCLWRCAFADRAVHVIFDCALRLKCAEKVRCSFLALDQAFVHSYG